MFILGVVSADSSHVTQFFDDALSDCGNGSINGCVSTESDDANSKYIFSPIGGMNCVFISVDENCKPCVE